MASATGACTISEYIAQTIQHSIDLESLVGKKYPKDQKCLSSMIGKSPTQQAELKFKQATTSLYIASQYMEHQETINDSTEIDWNNRDEYLLLSRRSTELLREGRARAAMARPVSEDDSVKVIKDKSVAIVDCGASSTLTGSLINASDIEEKVKIVETADGEKKMQSS